MLPTYMFMRSRNCAKAGSISMITIYIPQLLQYNPGRDLNGAFCTSSLLVHQTHMHEDALSVSKAVIHTKMLYMFYFFNIPCRTFKHSAVHL